MREMAYHSNVMTIIAKHPRRNIYCVLLSFHRRFLKLNLSENMGSSLIIKISVTRDTTMINIGNRLELKKGVPLAARLMKVSLLRAIPTHSRAFEGTGNPRKLWLWRVSKLNFASLYAAKAGMRKASKLI